jgi:glycerophosphoryl diester phosphodiesterase
VLPAHLDYQGRRVLLKYHKFHTGLKNCPPNSLSALEAALAGGAAAIEFDVGLMGDGGFALLHDDRLERETSGVGYLRDIELAQLKALRLRDSDEAPATLHEVVDRLRDYPQRLKVQVDLKAVSPLEKAVALGLLRTLEPLRERSNLRVVVGCLADWNLRLLKRLDTALLVGFDPAFYLHAPGPEPLTPLPTRVNAYGYVDDHPLGYRRVMPVTAYLEDRFESLISQLPGAVEFYLHKGFVAQALKDGFNPIDYLHQQTGALVDVWTLSSSNDGFEQELELMLAAGADQITTGTAIQLAEFWEGAKAEWLGEAI